jgi:hypothetical protein
VIVYGELADLRTLMDVPTNVRASRGSARFGVRCLGLSD